MAVSATNVNSNIFKQASTILNAMVQQATGQTAVAPANVGEYVTVGQQALKAFGVDGLIGELSNLIGKTMVAVKPYDGQLDFLWVTEIMYAYIVRKIIYGDKPAVDEDFLNITDGANHPQQFARKPDMAQFVYAGQDMWEDYYTIFDWQLRSAVQDASQMTSLVGGMLTNARSVWAQQRETLARGTLTNFIAGKVQAGNVVHLLTEYNAFSGVAVADILTDHFTDFVRWLYGRIGDLSDMMTNRSQLFHTNVTGHVVNRHTPREDQRVIIRSKYLRFFDTIVKSTTYHEGYLKLEQMKPITFWQSAQSPDTISLSKYTYLATDGTLSEGADYASDKVLGILYDRDAMGLTVMSDRIETAPYNAKYSFQTSYRHVLYRFWNSFDENGVVLMLD